MAKRDEYHGSGEPNITEEADMGDLHLASIDGSTSESIDHTISASIDGESCFRTRPLEIPKRSSCPQDISDSTQKKTDASSCYPAQM